MTPITREQMVELVRKSGGLVFPDNVVLSNEEVCTLLTDYRQQVIAELAQRSGKMPVSWGGMCEAADSREAIASLQAKLQEQEAEIKNLHTVMMAAAVEITEHWDAHCDKEGYGPVNLLRRLEKGFPEQYGYDAQTLVHLEQRAEQSEQRVKELEVLLFEVTGYFTRNDDLPNNLLPRIDAALTKEPSHEA